jgi:ParB/RepB/Spo0J family partition protein
MTDTLTPTTEYLDACPVGRIRVDPINPRTHIAVDDDFVASIAAGILEPLIVRVDPAKPQLIDNEGPVDFLLVAGHRRHLAAVQAGLDTVPVVVRHDLANDRAALVAMIVENGQRENLPPLDEARGIEQLVKFGMSQREAAKAIGREQGTVSKRLSLLKLPTRAQQLLDSGRISVKTALGLTGLVKHNDRMSRVLDWAAQHGDAEDGGIADRLHHELVVVQREKDAAAEAKKNEKLIAAARERGLPEVTDEDDGYDDLEPCDEHEATAFEVYGQGRVEWLKPYVEEEFEAVDPITVDQGDSATFDAAATDDDEDEVETYAAAIERAEREADNNTIAEAARDYVNARVALDTHAHVDSALNAIGRVDICWAALLEACGYADTADIATIDASGETRYDPADPAVAQDANDTVELPDVEPPWRGYDAFGTKAILKILNNADAPRTPEQLQACIAYEHANDRRQAIIDAAQHSLDELASVDA